MAEEANVINKIDVANEANVAKEANVIDEIILASDLDTTISLNFGSHSLSI